MNLLTSLESRLARLYTNFPNLPLSARRWLSTNAWWLILVIAILSAIGCLGLISGLVGLLVLNRNTQIYSVGYGAFNIVQTALSLLSSIVSVIFYFSAVKPLHAMRRLGWQLLFYAQLVGVAFAVLNILLSAIFLRSPLTIAGMIFGLAIGVLFTLVWLYFVFQIRDEFGSRVANAAEAVVVSKKTTRKK